MEVESYRRDPNEEDLSKALVVYNPDRIVQTVQCKAFTKFGRRCKNRTLRSGYCQPHLQQLRNLRIKQSNINQAGFGLFNGRKWRPKNSVIAEYTGSKSSTPINGNFVLEVSKNKFINGNRSIDTAGYANHCRSFNQKDKQCRGNNAKFTHDRRHNKVNLTTTKSIQPNQEIFVSYGRKYWRKTDHPKQPNVNSTLLMKLINARPIRNSKYTIRYISSIHRINEYDRDQRQFIPSKIKLNYQSQ